MDYASKIKHWDDINIGDVQTFTKTIANQGTTVLLVEQNVKQALKFSKRAYVLENGSIAMEDVSENLISNPHVQKAYLGL